MGDPGDESVAEAVGQLLEERPGVVRVKLDTGSWLLEPREGGKKTFVTYYLHTDPGGSLPAWVADKANKSSMPDVMRAVRKQATAR